MGNKRPAVSDNKDEEPRRSRFRRSLECSSRAMDLVGSVANVVNVALQIKEQVETFQQNKEDCKKIAARVERLRAVVDCLDNTVVSREQTMIDALKELEETFKRTLKLVKACQTKSKFWLFFTAWNVSKQLREVNEEIMEHMHIANFTNSVHQTVMFTRGYINDPAAKSKDVAEKLENTYPSNSSDVVRNFSLSELKAITNNFSSEHVIGTGGFAEVYKGVLPNGAEVAIKKFHPLPTTTKPVVGYVEVFSVLREHENVIRFLGYCHEIKIKVRSHDGKFVAVQMHDMLVVEEYIPNGNLSDQMHVMDWSSAFRIIRGIAQGVAYLHTKGIVHLDLKPGNILLDSKMNPKICDFELSKILKQDGEDASEEVTRDIVGTRGYLPPEYVADGILSFKHDVFSFGILLLHTISKPGLLQDSTEWVRDALEGGDVEGLLGLSRRDESELMEIKRCLDIGLQCAAMKRKDRPTIWEVVEMLDGKEQPRKIPLRRRASSFNEKGRALSHTL